MALPINGTGASEYLPGTTGVDTIFGLAGNDTIDGGKGSDILDGGDGDDSLFGGMSALFVKSADTLRGGLGNDTLDGGDGNDSMDGGVGNDVYYVDSLSDKATDSGKDASQRDKIIAKITGVSLNSTNFTGIEDLELFGAVLAGTGSNGANVLTGNAANNVLSGLGGDDTLNGLLGNDSLLGGDGADSLVGDDGADTLRGEAGADTLDGGAGDDLMDGGFGADVYMVNSLTDKVSDSGTSTIERDKITAKISGLSLAATNFAKVEDLNLGDSVYAGSGSSLGNVLTGNDVANFLDGAGSNDTLLGAGGNDTLQGGSGDDSMDGGAGSDTYYVDTLADKAIDGGTLAGERDKVIATVSNVDLSLSSNFSNIEDLTLDGVVASGTGSAAANVLTGNGSANTLNGLGGADTLIGLAGTDSLLGGAGDDSLSGGDGVDTLLGEAGNDTLDGGTGGDSMDGGIGADTYVVDLLADKVVDSGTLSTEHDMIIATITGLNLTNFSTIEDLTLSGTVLAGTGSSGANTLAGNAAANLLDGGQGNDYITGYTGAASSLADGNDTLLGGDGEDTLYGGNGDDILIGDSLSATGAAVGTGNDVLNGGTGVDTLYGGNGNDTYELDDVRDQVIEDSITGSGDDTVNYTLKTAGRINIASNIEVVYLLDVLADTVVGNDQINFVAANDAANLIDLKGGADGVFAGGGDDTVLGGADNDTIYGEAGNDWLDGGTGADLMSGGTDNDTYVVDTLGDVVKESTGAGSGNDTIRYQFTLTTGTEVTLADNVESALLIDTYNDTLYGNASGNVLQGNTGSNLIDGGWGNDSLYGGNGDDTLTGGDGSDLISGGIGRDVFFGGKWSSAEGIPADEDDLSSDTLAGGTGADLYYVYSMDDVIQEAADTVVGNADRIILLGTTETAYTMADEVECLQVGYGVPSTTYANASTQDLDIFGNSSSNQIYATGGNNVIDGDAGNDSIYAANGDDQLFGGDGNDSLNGGSGSDLLDGGAGNDSLSGGGGGDDQLYGGDGNDLLNGGSGYDFMDGGAGNDTMSGGSGGDDYFVDSSGDAVIEAVNGTDFDAVYLSYSDAAYQLSANVENLYLVGDINSQLWGTGNSQGNEIWGTEGADIVRGKGGNDSLLGYFGNDAYYYAAGDGADTIYEEGTAIEEGLPGSNDLPGDFLYLEGGLTRDKLWFQRVQGTDDLQIEVLGTNKTDSVTIANWFESDEAKVEVIMLFRPGTSFLPMHSNQVNLLVDAMAAMTKPATSLTPQQLTDTLTYWK